MTPAQLSRHFAGRADLLISQDKRAMTFAWYTAAFGRTKKLPRLQSILDTMGRGDDRPAQTWQTMHATVSAWTKYLKRDRGNR